MAGQFDLFRIPGLDSSQKLKELRKASQERMNEARKKQAAANRAAWAHYFAQKQKEEQNARLKNTKNSD